MNPTIIPVERTKDLVGTILPCHSNGTPVSEAEALELAKQAGAERVLKFEGKTPVGGRAWVIWSVER